MFLHPLNENFKGCKFLSDKIFTGGNNMAKIIESERRMVQLSVDDVLNIVREYQKLTRKSCCYEHTREILSKNILYVPEDI